MVRPIKTRFLISIYIRCPITRFPVGMIPDHSYRKSGISKVSWNNFPTPITNSRNISSFKKSLKIYIFVMYKTNSKGCYCPELL